MSLVFGGIGSFSFEHLVLHPEDDQSEFVVDLKKKRTNSVCLHIDKHLLLLLLVIKFKTFHLKQIGDILGSSLKQIASS